MVSAAMLLLVAWFAVHSLTGCVTTGPTVQVTNSAGTVTSTTIPRLQEVKPGLWRSGQPTTAQEWAFLWNIGISNVVKLNEGSEYSDQGAVNAGMKLRYFPIDVYEQMLPPGPSDQKMADIVAAMRQPGTLTHCEFGRDRTSLAVGMLRLADGWTKDAAWQEMTNHGYHPALRGLTATWRRQ